MLAPTPPSSATLQHAPPPPIDAAFSRGGGAVTLTAPQPELKASAATHPPDPSFSPGIGAAWQGGPTTARSDRDTGRRRHRGDRGAASAAAAALQRAGLLTDLCPETSGWCPDLTLLGHGLLTSSLVLCLLLCYWRGRASSGRSAQAYSALTTGGSRGAVRGSRCGSRVSTHCATSVVSSASGGSGHHAVPSPRQSQVTHSEVWGGV